MADNTLLLSSKLLKGSKFQLPYLVNGVREPTSHCCSTQRVGPLFILVCVPCVLSHFSSVRLFATLWTVAHQDPLSMGFSSQEYWSGLPSPPSGESSQPRDQIHVSYVSCIGRRVLYHQRHLFILNAVYSFSGTNFTELYVEYETSCFL